MPLQLSWGRGEGGEGERERKRDCCQLSPRWLQNCRAVSGTASSRAQRQYEYDTKYLDVACPDRHGERCPPLGVGPVGILVVREARGDAVRLAPAGCEVQVVPSAGHRSSLSLTHARGLCLQIFLSMPVSASVRPLRSPNIPRRRAMDAPPPVYRDDSFKATGEVGRHAKAVCRSPGGMYFRLRQWSAAWY